MQYFLWDCLFLLLDWIQNCIFVEAIFRLQKKITNDWIYVYCIYLWNDFMICSSWAVAIYTLDNRKKEKKTETTNYTKFTNIETLWNRFFANDASIEHIANEWDLIKRANKKKRPIASESFRYLIQREISYWKI